jgi:hypothetical protein
MKRSGGKKATAMHILVMIAVLLFPCLGIADQAPGKQDTGDITGRVFLDENADTVFEACDFDHELQDIPVRLYRDHCGGLIIQTVKTDEQGYFHFRGLEPGDYCLMPDAKMICEGYQTTKSLTQKVQVKAGEEVEAEWFAFDHFIDINE